MSWRTGRRKDDSTYHYSLNENKVLYSGEPLYINRVNSMSRRELNDEDIVSVRRQIAEIGQREFGSSHTGFVGLDLLQDDRVKVETKSLSERLLEAVESEGDDFMLGMLDEYETAYSYDPQSKIIEYLGDDGKVGWLEAKNFIEQNPSKYFVTFYADGILSIYPEVGKIPKKIKLVSLEEAWE